jgi:hypothetical protein
MENVLHWAEEHPWLAGGISLGIVLLVLWLLGFFSSSSTSQTSDTGQSNLAAAYYAAEAAQTTAATQLQMATVQYGAQTAIDAQDDNAAVAIAGTQANMYSTLGQQNASTETALGNDQLLASDNANDDALQASNTAYADELTADQQSIYGAETVAAINSILPAEFAAGGGTVGLGAAGSLQVTGTTPSPAELLAAGYSTSSPIYNQALGYGLVPGVQE